MSLTFFQVSLSSKSSREAEAVSQAAVRPGRGVDRPKAGLGMRSRWLARPGCVRADHCLFRSEGGGGSSVLKGAGGGQKENRAGGRARDIVDSLDEMLLNTEVCAIEAHALGCSISLLQGVFFLLALS